MLLQLLPEVREMIFFYCNQNDLKTLSLCGRALKDDLTEHLWRTVRIPFKKLKENNFIDDVVIEGLKHTKVLLIGHEFGSMYSAVRGSHQFRTAIQHCNPSVIVTGFLPNDAFNVFGEFDKLTDLHFTSYNATDYALRIVYDKLNGLKLLSVTGSIVTDEGLKRLGNLKNLETLDISECCRVTDEGLAYVAHVKLLTNLNISGCSGVTSEGVGHLRVLKLLTLDISKCHRVDDTGLSVVASIVTLRELNLSMCPAISDVGLKYVGSLDNLRKLDVTYCDKISDMGLLNIVAHNCKIKRT